MMKHTTRLWTAALLLAAATAHAQTVLPTDRFSSDNGDGTYTNPVVRGDYPDTDVIRVGDDYYMISSSFACMPGIPVCHSKDLINWRVVGHAYDRLTFLPSYSMEREQTAYGRACWAPTMRYHDGWYYIGVNLKADRFIMCKSRNPEGPYKMYAFNEELYDPGMFIDDDGKKYITHGMNEIRITRLRDDGTEIMTPGDKGTVILRAPETHHLYFEGCHMYKHDGYYYIFNPSQGYNGFQMVSRSRNLYGPYETRVLIDDDGGYAGSGVHQGGMVDTPTGEWWAFTFQDRDYMGRDMMLYPMRWVDGWPVVGLDPDTTQITPQLKARMSRLKEGKSVTTYRKPNVGKGQQPLAYPQQSDDFDGKRLSAVWEFSHVPLDDKWSLKARPSHLRLYASPAKGYEWARNSVTQKCVMPAGTGTAKVDVSHLAQGDFAGNGIMGSTMLQQGVMRTATGYELQMHQSRHSKDETVARKPLPDHLTYIWLRTEVTKRGTVKFSYSLDGESYEPFGKETPSGFWRFLGLRHALCCYNHTEDKDSAYYTTEKLVAAHSGYADFDSFTLDSPYRGNHYDAFSTVDLDLFDDKEAMRLVRPVDYTPEQYLAVTRPEAWLSLFNLEFARAAQKCTVELKARMSDAVVELHEGGVDGRIIATHRVKATGGKWARQTFNAPIAAGTHKITLVCRGGTDQMYLRNMQFE